MKIVVSAKGSTPECELDPRFGRAGCFLVFDTESGAWQSVDNSGSQSAAQGAGIQSAETVARSGAGCLVTGHCGPKAFRVLNAAGIAIYNCGEATVADALKAFRDGTLHKMETADVDGHWV